MDRAGHEAVRGVTLEMAAGDFVSIVGRSGSGKSTLLAMLGALTRPTEGRVLHDGTDLWTLSEAELAMFRYRHIGFIFQFPSLLPNLTALTMSPFRPCSAARSTPRGLCAGLRLLARIGLADRAGAYPGSLSGGEQRRVVIARALINSPRCCSPTSRRAISTSTPKPRSSIFSKSCNAANPSALSSSRTIWSSPGTRRALTRCGRACSKPSACRKKDCGRRASRQPEFE